MRANDFIKEETIPQSKFKHLLTPGVLTLKDAMENAGKEVRIVGGAVRDLVLGKNPKDIDMATDATPEEMMAIFDSAGISHIPTGIEHGTITAVLDGEPIEITTLRVDTNQDGRHADVEFTTDWKTDAERRDLTYNAMSLDLDGNLYDYFGGVADLKKGDSKFVGNADQRIKEDYLRILRYYRFRARMPYQGESVETFRAISDNVEGLKEISGERIWMEFSKILTSEFAARELDAMYQSGVMRNIGLPDNHMMMGNFEKISKITKDVPVLLAEIANNEVTLNKLRARWKFSNAVYDATMFVLQNRARTATELRRLISRPKVDRDNVVRVALFRANRRLASDLRHTKIPEFPVRAQDLLDAGMKPGPEVGKAMQMMRAAWEKSGFKLTAEELINNIS